HLQERLKDLIFSERIDAKGVPDPAGPEIVVDLLSVAIGEVEDHGVAYRVSGANREPFHVHPAVVEIGINQVRIDGELLDVLVKRLDRPVVFLLNFADAETNLVGVTLVALVRVTGRGGAIVAFQVYGEISECAHRNFAKFPAEFRRHIEDHQAVDTGLVRRNRRIADPEIRIANEVDVKTVAVTRVIVEGRRHLKKNVFGEIDLRADLPRQKNRVRVRHAAAARD